MRRQRAIAATRYRKFSKNGGAGLLACLPGGEDKRRRQARRPAPPAKTRDADM
jgi:hypothetical protein